MPQPNAVLFDLDGTLTDSFPGITNCFRYALEKLGEPVPTPEALSWCVGPPLHESFEKMLGPDRVDQAVHLYRERYADLGAFESTVYDGIFDALGQLATKRLLICTSKTVVYIPRILENKGLAPYFESYFGSNHDGTGANKGDIIATCLAATGLKPDECVMIGDRSHDMIGAVRNGVRPIGAAWGYAEPGELEQSGAIAVAQTPRDLPGIIQSL